MDAVILPEADISAADTVDNEHLLLNLCFFLPCGYLHLSAAEAVFPYSHNLLPKWLLGCKFVFVFS